MSRGKQRQRKHKTSSASVNRNHPSKNTTATAVSSPNIEDADSEKPAELQFSEAEESIFLQWLGPGSFSWQQDATLAMLRMGEEAEKRDGLEVRLHRAFVESFPGVSKTQLKEYAVRIKTALSDEDHAQTPEEYVQRDGGKAFTEFISSMPQYIQEALGSLSFFESVTHIPTSVIMRESALVSLLSQLEVLMSNLLFAIWTEPEQFKKKFGGQQISWGELLTATDLATHVEDEKRAAIESAVTDAMGESFPNRIKKFATLLDNPSIVPKRELELLEMLTLVRNRIIHAAGRPTPQTREFYLREYQQELAEDETLPITDRLVSDCADACFVVAFTLSSACMSKCSTNDLIKTRFESRLSDQLFSLLQQRRYSTVERVGDAVIKSRFRSEETRLIFRVNYWLALQQLGKFERCADDVRRWQVGHLGEHFQLAKETLLGNMEAARDRAARMREDGKLTDREWLSWPLLEPLRAGSTR